MKIAPTLPGKSVTLRQTQLSDYPALKRILNDKITMEKLIPFFGVDTWTDDMVAKRYDDFQKFQDDGQGLNFVVERNKDKLVVGSCGFKKIDRNFADAEFGIILHHSVWAQGVARECHFLALSHGFEELKLGKVYFETDEQNMRMRGFFDKYSIPFSTVAEKNYYRYELLSSHWPKTKALLKKE